MRGSWLFVPLKEKRGGVARRVWYPLVALRRPRLLFVVGLLAADRLQLGEHGIDVEIVVPLDRLIVEIGRAHV